MLETATAGAATVIERRRGVTLSNEAFDQFMAELDKPATVVPQLGDLFRRHPKLTEGD